MIRYTNKDSYIALMNGMGIQHDILTDLSNLRSKYPTHADEFEKATTAVAIWGPKPKIIYCGEVTCYMFFDKDGKFVACMPALD